VNPDHGVPSGNPCVNTFPLPCSTPVVLPSKGIHQATLPNRRRCPSFLRQLNTVACPASASLAREGPLAMAADRTAMTAMAHLNWRRTSDLDSDGPPPLMRTPSSGDSDSAPAASTPRPRRPPSRVDPAAPANVSQLETDVVGASSSGELASARKPPPPP
jgi:hypothetical protein